MKTTLVLFSWLTFFVALGAIQVCAQVKSHIAVRSSDLNNGVVVMTVQKASKEYQLQCNKDAPSCTTLRNGNYQMVELPIGFGLYDCKDVEVYSESAGMPDNAPEKDKRLGEYCLVQK